MSDFSNMSVADAIAPAPSPAPAPASAPAPAAPVTPSPTPQPAGAGTVNPYVPPPEAPQLQQEPTPAAPSGPDPGQPPAQPGQPGDQPQIPQEYLQAHEWRGQIEKEAQAFGGVDMVPQALKWSRLLFGLEAPPEGMSPAGHFMQNLFNADRETYQDILNEIATTHVGKLIPLLEDEIFAKHEIPKERLSEVRDYLRYGRVAASDAASREFVALLRPELQGIFPKLSETTRNWLVDQVDRGYMTLDLAEETIREKGILLAIEARDAQAKQREADAVTTESTQRARSVANEAIARYENVFVEAYAREHGVDVEDVREKIARVAGELDAAASQDERHPARIAWQNLLKASASGNEMKIKGAMNQMQIVFEQAFNSYMARRGKAPAPTNGLHQPQQPRQPQQPQFEPARPNNTDDWTKVPLDDYLFGRAGA